MKSHESGFCLTDNLPNQGEIEKQKAAADMMIMASCFIDRTLGPEAAAAGLVTALVHFLVSRASPEMSAMILGRLPKAYMLTVEEQAAARGPKN